MECWVLVRGEQFGPSFALGRSLHARHQSQGAMVVGRSFAVGVNLLTGGVISFLFYFLVVVIPESRKKSIIKSNLRNFYRDIKRDILWQVVFAWPAPGSEDTEFGVTMGPEVGHGEAEVYTGVQA